MKEIIAKQNLSSVANNLIDKISSAISWVASHDTPERIALNTFIEDIQKGDYDPVTKAAFISNAKKIIKEYENQMDIVKVATQFVNGNATPDKMDDDWIAQFMDKAKLVSNKDLQFVWGKILADECNHQGTIPKTLLHILTQMDNKDAKVFSVIRSLSVYVEDDGVQYTPIILRKYMADYYEKMGITYDALVNLQALGLIEMNMNADERTYVFECDKHPITVKYYDKEYDIPQKYTYFNVGNVIFTKAGSALCRNIEMPEKEGFFEEICIPLWKELMI